MRCHIRNQKKMLLGDMSSLPLILARLCFLKPWGAHTTPSQTHATNGVHTLFLPWCLRGGNRSGLLSAWWHGMWTSKSAGYMKFGGFPGDRVPSGAWECALSSSQALALRGLWVLWAGWVSVGRGSPLGFQDSGTGQSLCPLCLLSRTEHGFAV